MIIDFSFNGKINFQYSRLYNRIALDIQKPFIELIDFVSKQHKRSIDWWVSSPASRNIFGSSLFHYCCCLTLLQELIRERDPINDIVTDSKAFKQIIESYLTKQRLDARVTLAPLSAKQRLKNLFRPIYLIFALPLQHLLLFLIARRTRYLCQPLKSEPLTLIDTFVSPGYIEKDRYYPGVLLPLSKEVKEKVIFVPHLYGFRPWQYLQVVKRLRKSERNFLLKDDFLKFRDYWCLWRHIFRIRKLQMKPSFFRRVDISALMREELTGFRRIGSSYIPLLNFYFVKRLKQAGVNVRLVIDWFENQDIDKGWNGGFRRFFPDTKTKGYQGFIVSSHYLCMFPTEEEKRNAVIPHEIMVMGKGLRNSVSRFCPGLDVNVAPAFRFQHTWRERSYWPVANAYTILVALPIMVSEGLFILRSLKPISNGMVDDTKFRIKLHPTVSQSQIRNAFGSGWPAQFEFVDGDFGKCVEKAHLLISSASSVCMETMVKGIPVIIVGNGYGLTHNPIPEAIIDDIWRMCYGQDEIQRAIQFFKDRSPAKIEDHEEVGRRLRKEYFEAVTEKGIMKFFDLDESLERGYG
jgi:hypothetical protein